MKARLYYTGIRVRDLDRSIGFYTGVLGMKLEGRFKLQATGGEVASLVSEEKGHSLELNYYAEGSKYFTPYAQGESLDHLAFQVEDLDGALSEAERAGYPTVLDIKGEKSRWAYIQDPDGNYIELFA